MFHIPRQAINDLEELVRLSCVAGSWRGISKTDKDTLQHVATRDFSPGLGWVKSIIQNTKKGTISEDDKERYYGMIASVERELNKCVIKFLSDYGYQEGNCRFFFSFLRTLADYAQGPHIDFPWHFFGGSPLEAQKSCPKCRKTPHACPNSDVLPFSIIIPITRDGSQIEVWPDVVSPDTHNRVHPVNGHIVHIQYGYGFAFRGDTVHSGSFKIGEDQYLNERVHLYLYPSCGRRQHSPGYTNQHKTYDGVPIEDFCYSTRDTDT